MYQPVVLREKLDDEHMNIYRQYMRNIFSSLMKAKRFVQLRVPTDENSEGSSLEPEIFRQRMLEAYDMDYDMLKASCEEKISEIKDRKSVIIKNGRLISSSNEEFNSFIRQLPENGGNIICEFGIGMNPNITELIGYTVLDEKMAGTFHIAIGDNTMFGGKNSAPLHIDFVGKGDIIFA